MRAHPLPPDPSPPSAGAAFPIPMVHLPDEPPRWEYRVLSRDVGADGPVGEDALNELGREGWELAGLAASGGAVHHYFKRPA